ncbi:AMP-binding protein [Vibrio sp. PP-XX7]
MILQWDSNDDLFPPQLIDTLFDVYTQQINTLIDDPQVWDRPFPDLMPEAQKAVRQTLNAPYQPEPQAEAGLDDDLLNGALSEDKLLHDGFFHQAALQPQAIALITGQQQWCYGELAAKAQRGAGTLISRGIQVGETVAVSMTKGPGQVIAVLSILQAGAVYVPVSLDQPQERRLAIYHGAEARLILTCADDQTAVVGHIPHLTWQEATEGPENTTPRRPDPQQPAYIIYTSGSTGTPKGVIIAHLKGL